MSDEEKNRFLNTFDQYFLLYGACVELENQAEKYASIGTGLGIFLAREMKLQAQIGLKRLIRHGRAITETNPQEFIHTDSPETNPNAVFDADIVGAKDTKFLWDIVDRQHQALVNKRSILIVEI